LPPAASPWLKAAWALFCKDALAERRNRAALNASLLFAATALIAVAFSLGPTPVPPKVLAAILWVVLFFAATAGLSRSFVAEEESGTAPALRLSGSANAVLLGKLLANLALMAVLAAVVLPLFVLLLHLPIGNGWGFAGVVLLGTLALSAAATVAAALVAKARGRGELFAGLAFPLLIPGLTGAILGTQACLPGAAGSVLQYLQLLLGYDGALLAVAFLVFEVLWEE
jgi:heme exporter protein B